MLDIASAALTARTKRNPSQWATIKPESHLPLLMMFLNYWNQFAAIAVFSSVLFSVLFFASNAIERTSESPIK